MMWEYLIIKFQKGVCTNVYQVNKGSGSTYIHMSESVMSMILIMEALGRDKWELTAVTSVESDGSEKITQYYKRMIY